MAREDDLASFLQRGDVVRTPRGAPFTVAPAHADRFRGFLADLERSGIRIDPTQSGGLNPRYIAGTRTPSPHAFGNAIDVNWRDNPRGQLPPPPTPDNRVFDPLNITPDAAGDRTGQTVLPPDLARALARAHGLEWGGNWRGTPDAMHFQIPRGPQPPPPVRDRAIVAAGFPRMLAPPVTPPPPTQTPPPSPSGAELLAGMRRFPGAERQDVPPWQTTVRPEPPPTQIPPQVPGVTLRQPTQDEAELFRLSGQTPPPVTPPPTQQPPPAPRQEIGPWQTTVRREPEPQHGPNLIGDALARAVPETDNKVNPFALGLLTSLGNPQRPPPPGWLSNPYRQITPPGLARRDPYRRLTG